MVRCLFHSLPNPCPTPSAHLYFALEFSYRHTLTQQTCFEERLDTRDRLRILKDCKILWASSQICASFKGHFEWVLRETSSQAKQPELVFWHKRLVSFTGTLHALKRVKVVLVRCSQRSMVCAISI